MIFAVRYPSGFFQAHAVPSEQWNDAVLTDQGFVYWVGKKAGISGVTENMEADKAKLLYPNGIYIERNALFEQAWVDDTSAFWYAFTPQVFYHGRGIFLLQGISDAASFSWPREAAVGGAADKLTALLACFKAADGHQLILDDTKRNYFLANTPVQALSNLGISENTLLLLQWSGFETLQKASQLSKKQLQLQFGDDGLLLQRLFYAGKDEQTIPWYQPPQEVRLQVEISYAEKTAQIIDNVVKHASERLVALLSGKGAQLIRMRFSHAKTDALIRVLKEPVFTSDRLQRLLRAFFVEILPASSDELLLEIRLQALKSQEGPVGDLFRKPAVQHAIKRVHRRFPGRLFSFSLISDTLFPEQAFKKQIRSSR